MKVAFNILPLRNGHKTRGIGVYTRNLLKELKKTNLEIQEFKSILEVGDADVVHYPWFDLFSRTLYLRKKIPTVVTVHDVMPFRYPKNYPIGLRGKINFYFQKRALKACKKIITISQCSKKDIVKLLGIKEEKIVVIPEAADKQFQSISDAKLLSIKRKYNLPDQFILFVGDANFVKNLPFLIEGFRLLRESSDFQDLKLVLVGGVFLKNVENINHPELESLKQVNKKIQEYHLDNFVVRPGQVDTTDLVGFYNLATVYVQPSLYEGFGLPILEAMSCGTPVVSSKTSSLPEVGGEAVVYFDPEDINDFVKVLSEVLLKTSLRKKLSDDGMKQAAKFSWERTAYETLQVYKKACERV